MSPEALEGRAGLTSDVYSLAVTIAHCLGEPLPPGLGQPIKSGRFTAELSAAESPDPAKRPSAAQTFELFWLHAAEQSQDALQALQDTGIAGGPVGQEPLLEQIQAQLRQSQNQRRRTHTYWRRRLRENQSCPNCRRHGHLCRF